MRWETMCTWRRSSDWSSWSRIWSPWRRSTTISGRTGASHGENRKVCYVVILLHKTTCSNFCHIWWSTFQSHLEKYLFYHSWSNTIPNYCFFHYRWLTNYFHCSWSSTSSIAGGQLLPLQLVNYFFHFRLSTSSSIAAGHQLLPLQLVNYFFRCRWSTSSIAAGQLLLALQMVNFFFHCSW